LQQPSAAVTMASHPAQKYPAGTASISSSAASAIDPVFTHLEANWRALTSAADIAPPERPPMPHLPESL